VTAKKSGKSTIGIGETGLPSLSGLDSEQTSTVHTETINVAGVGYGAEHPVLIVIKGLDAGRIMTIGRAPVTIGRAQDSALVVPDRGVSAHHARLTIADPNVDGLRHLEFILEDLRSKNGTFIDGVAIKEPKSISFGDSFQVGPDVLIRLGRMTAQEDQAARHLYASSMRDALTNVFNRRYFAQRLHAELAHSTRHRTAMSVLVLNLDHFKRINDAHGHKVGDVVLQTVARALLRELRADDVLARVESQDFAVLLRGLDEKAAIACAERVRSIIAKEPLPTIGTSSLTASIGIATSADKSENILELASSRLRTAKSLGRNQVCWT
jgi:diguanylate cyclase (GGDEF)-like protein